MDEYLIGAGALLTAGPNATVTAATLHAQTDPELARRVGAAVIDFESAGEGELSRLLILAAGWGGARFHADVVEPLLARRECSFGDVVAMLAAAVGIGEVHLFARWTPSPATQAFLGQAGIRLIGHPLESIGQAALVCGQRVERWKPVKAA